MIFECEDKHFKIVEEVLASLSYLEDKDVRSCVVMVITEDNQVIIKTDGASFTDLVLMNGYMNLSLADQYYDLKHVEISEDEEYG